MVGNETPKSDLLKFSNPTVAIGFTQQRIDRLKPRGKTYPVRDTESGMYCYVTPSGSKIYKTYKKFRGSPQRITIGDAKSWSIKEARKQHHKNIVDIESGINPRFKALQQGEPTVESAIVEYLGNAMRNDKHRATSSALYYSLLSTLPNKIKKRPFSDLHLRDWENLYEDFKATGKWSKNYNTFRLIHSVWNSLDLEGKSPKVMLTNKYGRETFQAKTKIDKYLSPIPSYEHIGQFIHHAIRITFGDFRDRFTEQDLLAVGKKIPDNFVEHDVYDPKPEPANVVYFYATLFILLTGFRLRNALDLEWKDVDLKGRVITIQNLKGQDTRVYMKMTKQILWLMQHRRNTMRNFNCKYVFPSNRTMTKTVKKLDKFLPAVLKEMNNDSVPHITAHALRRTVPNVSLQLGHESVYQGVLLFHSPKSTADKNYVERDEHKHLEKLTEVNDFIDNRITEILLNNDCNFGAFPYHPTNQAGEKIHCLAPINKENNEYPSGIAFLCGLAKKLNVMEGFYYHAWEQQYPQPEFDAGEDY